VISRDSSETARTSNKRALVIFANSSKEKMTISIATLVNVSEQITEEYFNKIYADNRPKSFYLKT